MCRYIDSHLGCLFRTTAAPRKEVYFMAIIDILQHYDAKKKAAHAAKTVKHGVRGCLHLNNSYFLYNDYYDWHSCVCVLLTGRSGDLHSEPGAVLQEVLRFHHHYPVVVSGRDRGTEAQGKERARG